MKVEITKGTDRDWIEISRDEESPEKTSFPKKGPMPHDAVHFIVETELKLRNGFWGMVADGVRVADVQDIAKKAGHASASRARLPDASIVELLQVERLVECFEADIWSGADDVELFQDIARVACESSFVPDMQISTDAIKAIRSQLKKFQAAWTVAPIGHTVSFEWREN